MIPTAGPTWRLSAEVDGSGTYCCFFCFGGELKKAKGWFEGRVDFEMIGSKQAYLVGINQKRMILDIDMKDPQFLF